MQSVVARIASAGAVHLSQLTRVDSEETDLNRDPERHRVVITVSVR